ncbi:hypothetical protein R1T08_13575 [Streptomyces sp. SBC-4]|nr:hypothetical protein [Streptomyces sp. SBC-4]MDV5145220.1 hypothetical protein [Streptomyces sp. SBC-4]
MNKSVATALEIGSIEQELAFAELMLHAFVDPAFAARYASDPDTVLKESGIDLHEGAAAPAIPATTGLDAVTEEYAAIAADGTTLLTLCIRALPVADVAPLAPLSSAGH